MDAIQKQKFGQVSTLGRLFVVVALMFALYFYFELRS